VPVLDAAVAAIASFEAELSQSHSTNDEEDATLIKNVLKVARNRTDEAMNEIRAGRTSAVMIALAGATVELAAMQCGKGSGRRAKRLAPAMKNAGIILVAFAKSLVIFGLFSISQFSEICTQRPKRDR